MTDWQDVSTLGRGLSKQAPPTPDQERVLPTLTVAYHVETARIGDRHFCGRLNHGEVLDLSRLMPSFSAFDGSDSKPLADPFLSRRTLLNIKQEPHGFRFERAESDGEVRLDGKPLEDVCFLPMGAIQRGITIELVERMVLVFHPSQPPGVADLGLDKCAMIGESDGIQQVRRQIAQVADLDRSVLIRGESGTGKELVAAAIHRKSRRSGGPFVSVNMGEISKELATSELFGSVKGGFTGATGRVGYFGRAAGGTLFLDEIGETSEAAQVTLLRVLECGEYHPVGSPDTVKSDVRIITATDAALEEMMASQSFRAPLFHRLAAFELVLPPLRERREDVGRLLIHFLRRETDALGESHRLESVGEHGAPWIPSAVVARFVRSDWPGNVRQLSNLVSQLVIGNRGLTHFKVPQHVAHWLAGESDEVTEPCAPVVETPAPKREPASLTEEELIQALRENNWELGKAGKQLGVSRPSLYRLIGSFPRIRLAGDLTGDEITACFQACGGDLSEMTETLQVSKSALRRRIKELRLS